MSAKSAGPTQRALQMLLSVPTGSIFIRIAKKDLGRAFRPLIAFGPVHAFKLTPQDKVPVYAVSPLHLQLLDAIDIPYEIIPSRRRATKRRRKPTRGKRPLPARSGKPRVRK